MTEFLDQPVYIGQLSQYLFNPYGFWATYALVMFLLRNKINNFQLEDKPYSIVGKGFAWCYVVNLFFIYCNLKWIQVCTGDSFYESPILILGLSSLLYLSSFITVYPMGIALLIMSVAMCSVKIHLPNFAGEFLKKII